MKKSMGIFLALVMVLTFSVGASAIDVDEHSSEKLTCERVEELPDGGHIYTYIVRGVEHHFPVPPDGFDPLVATDEQLETYCFPRRPVTRDIEAMENWQALVENYSGTPIPELSLGERTVTKSQRATETRATSTRKSWNWAGYAVSGSVYTQVQMDYTEPDIISAVSGAASCEWVGLGGFSDSNDVYKLVQAGTVQIGTSSHKAWYEYLSNASEDTYYPMTYIDSLSIRANDKIHVYISFQRANDRFEYYIANNTTGKSSAMYIDDVDADVFYDGTTAEWIVERPTLKGSIMPLCNFGSITLDNCQFTTNANNTWRKLGDYNNEKLTMYGNNNKMLCQPSAITGSDSFTCTWKAAQ